jgi:hypothetical protein
LPSKSKGAAQVVFGSRVSDVDDNKYIEDPSKDSWEPDSELGDEIQRIGAEGGSSPYRDQKDESMYTKKVSF